MTLAHALIPDAAPIDYQALAHNLGPVFAARANEADDHDSFVAANFAEL